MKTQLTHGKTTGRNPTHLTTKQTTVTKTNQTNHPWGNRVTNWANLHRNQWENGKNWVCNEFEKRSATNRRQELVYRLKIAHKTHKPGRVGCPYCNKTTWGPNASNTTSTTRNALAYRNIKQACRNGMTLSQKTTKTQKPRKSTN